MKLSLSAYHIQLVKRVLWWFVWAVTGVLLVSVILISSVYLRSRPYRYDASSVPSHTVGIVLGARVKPQTGEVGEVLKLRMDAAIAMYREGKIKKLLLSGDGRFEDYDEVAAMVRYAQSQDVPLADIVQDREGMSTYASCERASTVFGLRDAVIFTNSYHEPRAIVTCRKLGVQVDGAGVANYRGFELELFGREWPAMLKMYWELYVHYKAPTVDSTQPAISPIVPASTASPSPEATLAPSTLNFIFGGDIMLGRAVEGKIKAKGIDYPFSGIADVVRGADIAVANLESMFKEDAKTTAADSLVLRGYPAAAPGLKSTGFDMLSMANNHVTDMGSAGVSQTIQLLEGLGIAHAGASTTSGQENQPAVIEKNGVKVAFLSYTYGVNFTSPGVYFARADADQVKVDVAAAKKSADMVVVLCHCGTEYARTSSKSQQEFAHTAIDAGAALVIGHHPHVPEEVEVYNGGLIAYSLGNLVFDQQTGGFRDESALLSVSVSVGSENSTGGKLVSAKLLPYKILDYSHPVLLTDQAEKEKVWGVFQVPGGEVKL